MSQDLTVSHFLPNTSTALLPALGEKEREQDERKRKTPFSVRFELDRSHSLCSHILTTYLLKLYASVFTQILDYTNIQKLDLFYLFIFK